MVRRELAGGLGEIVDRRTASRDLKLIKKALADGWQIPPATMASLPEEMLRLATESEDDRVRVNAAKVLVTMFGQAQPKQQAQVNVQVNTGSDLYD